jgi:hypothetical protein
MKMTKTIDATMQLSNREGWKYLTLEEIKAYEEAMDNAASEREEDKIIWDYVKIECERELAQPISKIDVDKTFVFALAALVLK